MDPELLVEAKDDGKRLVEQLVRQGFDVTTAFWLKLSIDDKWYKWRFYIVSPVVDREGTREGYGQLLTIVQAMPQPFCIDPLKITLLSPGDPVARAVMALHAGGMTARVFPPRWESGILGNLYAEEAYFYPILATTP